MRATAAWPSMAALRRIATCSQDVVAGMVAEQVVDRLEAVEVEDADRERRGIVGAVADQPVDLVEEAAQVAEPGQRVGAEPGRVPSLLPVTGTKSPSALLTRLHSSARNPQNDRNRLGRVSGSDVLRVAVALRLPRPGPGFSEPLESASGRQPAGNRLHARRAPSLSEMTMPLKVAVQMDHVSTVSIAGDTTFALSLEAQRRGHALFHYTPDRLSLLGGRVDRADRADAGARRQGRPLHARRAGADRPVARWTWCCCGRTRPST